MKDKRIAVSINAKIEYLDPPSTVEEETFRKHTDAIIDAMAFRLNDAVALIIAEMVLNQVLAMKDDTGEADEPNRKR